MSATRRQRTRSQHAAGPRKAAATAAAVAALAALAAAAHAQLSGSGNEPVAAIEGSGAQPDTDYTPKAKQTELWEQVAGARYPQDEVIKGSATSFETDLYTVRFRNLFNGAAGGSKEIECAGGERKRVPVLYQYFEGRDNIESGWHDVPKADLNSDCGHPGYVGAVAWISPDRALAVGGTGTYPKREPAYDPGAQDLAKDEPYGLKNDPAGKGRAWLYDPARYGDRDWHELEVPAGMRGLSALDFDPLSGGANSEWGAAGGLGQLWDWTKQNNVAGGGFTAKYERASDRDDGLAPIRFRVREIEVSVAGNARRAYAVTAGCCAQDALHGRPKFMGATGPGGWGMADLPGQYFHTNLDNSIKPSSSRPDKELSSRKEMPDSFYSLTIGPYRAGLFGGGVLVSAIATPGGPPNPILGLSSAHGSTSPRPRRGRMRRSRRDTAGGWARRLPRQPHMRGLVTS